MFSANHSKARVVVSGGAFDNPSLRSLLEDDYEVILAESQEEVPCIARREQPELIVVDVGQETDTAQKICGQIDASSAISDIPVIVLADRFSPEHEVTVLDHGASDYLAKPVNPSVMRARLRRRLKIKRQSDSLRELAYTDGLTGMGNRRAFDDRLATEWRRGCRTETPLSILLLDIDNFKRYNDSYGHQAGDTCLQQVADALQRCMRRASDFVARYGGEEFAVLLPGLDSRGAAEVADRIVKQVRVTNVALPTDEVARFVTVSIGVSCGVPCRVRSAEDLLAKADLLLYEAKEVGKDRWQAQSPDD